MTLAPLASLSLAGAMFAADAPPSAKVLSLAKPRRPRCAISPRWNRRSGRSRRPRGGSSRRAPATCRSSTATATYQRTTANFAPRPGRAPDERQRTAAPPAVERPDLQLLHTSAPRATQLIYDFGLTSGRWRSASASRDAASWNRRAIENQTLLDVRRAYFQGRAQRDLVAVAEEAVRNQEKHLEQSAGAGAGRHPPRHRLGDGADRAGQRARAAGRRPEQLRGRRRRSWRRRWACRVGRRLRAGRRRAPADRRRGRRRRRRWRRARWRHRPELANLASQRTGAGADGRRRCAAATAPASARSPTRSRRGSSSTALVPNWYVGLTLNWGIFQGGYTHGQVREAKGDLRASAARRRRCACRSRSTSSRRRLGVQAAKATITAAEEALVNARDQLSLAEARYKQGLGSVIELGRRAGRLHDRGGAGGAGAVRAGGGARAAAGRAGGAMSDDERDGEASWVGRRRLRRRGVDRASRRAARPRRRAGGRRGGREAGRARRARPIASIPVVVDRRRPCATCPSTSTGSARVTAYKTVTVHAQVDGRLDKVVFREGQAVKKGELLAQIDPRPFADPAAPGRGGARARHGAARRRASATSSATQRSARSS